MHIVLLGAMHTVLQLEPSSHMSYRNPNPEPINAHPRLKPCSGPEHPREGFGWAPVRGSSVLGFAVPRGFRALGFCTASRVHPSHTGEDLPSGGELLKIVKKSDFFNTFLTVLFLIIIIIKDC